MPFSFSDTLRDYFSSRQRPDSNTIAMHTLSAQDPSAPSINTQPEVSEAGGLADKGKGGDKTGPTETDKVSDSDDDRSGAPGVPDTSCQAQPIVSFSPDTISIRAFAKVLDLNADWTARTLLQLGQVDQKVPIVGRVAWSRDDEHGRARIELEGFEDSDIALASDTRDLYTALGPDRLIRGQILRRGKATIELEICRLEEDLNVIGNREHIYFRMHPPNTLR